MELSVFLFLLIILMVTFYVKEKNISSYEIVILWMFIWIVTHTISTTIIVNLKLFVIDQNLTSFWTHVIKRIFLYPLIIIWSFDFLLAYKSKLLKIIHLLSTICFLIIIEHIFLWIGVLHNKNWNFLYSFIEWTFCITVSYLFWKWLRKQIPKGS